jgi:regulator of ribonuclease activity A
MNWKTTDLCDAHAEVQAAEPLLKHFGQRNAFAGPISTVSCFEDNSLVREALSEPGEGRVLVVDGGGSLRCALLGDQLAQLAVDNGWAGVLVHGCVRDSTDLARIDLGVLALASHPRRSVKRGEGRRGEEVHFAGVRFVPGAYLYADSDGVIIADRRLDS